MPPAPAPAQPAPSCVRHRGAPPHTARRSPLAMAFASARVTPRRHRFVPGTHRVLEQTRVQQIAYVPSVNTSTLLFRRQLQKYGGPGGRLNERSWMAAPGRLPPDKRQRAMRLITAIRSLCLVEPPHAACSKSSQAPIGPPKTWCARRPWSHAAHHHQLDQPQRAKPASIQPDRHVERPGPPDLHHIEFPRQRR